MSPTLWILLFLTLAVSIQTSGAQVPPSEIHPNGGRQLLPTDTPSRSSIPGTTRTTPPAGNRLEQVGEPLSQPRTDLFATPFVRVTPTLKPPPTIRALSAILIDAGSGQVLYAHNADLQRPMASTTKIMTALVFCEHVPDENTLVTASKYASTISESSLHLKAGEQLTAHDLLRAILMRSANDACVAAAEYVSGNVTSFADLMNRRARELGCKRTHFVNPNGLHDKYHYTTAHDLALIAREALQCPRIDEVVRLEHCRIARSIDKQDLTMRNHSVRFLKAYSGADGIKTGWTVPAGHCFVGSATRNGFRLIAVVLKSPDFVHETAQLLDYGFANYDSRTIAGDGPITGTCDVIGGMSPTLPLKLKRPLEVVVPKSVVVNQGDVQFHLTVRPQVAPVAVDTVVGEAKAIWNGRIMAVRPIFTSRGTEIAPPPPPPPPHIPVSSKSLTWLTSIFCIAVVSLFYYAKIYRQNSGQESRSGLTTLTKSARRRWRRITKSLRSTYR